MLSPRILRHAELLDVDAVQCETLGRPAVFRREATNVELVRGQRLGFATHARVDSVIGIRNHADMALAAVAGHLLSEGRASRSERQTMCVPPDNEELVPTGPERPGELPAGLSAARARAPSLARQTALLQRQSSDAIGTTGPLPPRSQNIRRSSPLPAASAWYGRFHRRSGARLRSCQLITSAPPNRSALPTIAEHRSPACWGDSPIRSG